MDLLLSDLLWELLLISLTFSVFLMALVQKVKKSHIFHHKWQIWCLNLVLAFAMGIPFTMMFYEKTLVESIWVCLFGFIGAPSIYEVLKKQTLISYKPSSSGLDQEKEKEGEKPSMQEAVPSDAKDHDSSDEVYG